MAINTTAADIEKLALMRDVLQEQIDARIAAHDTQILEMDSFFKARRRNDIVRNEWCEKIVSSV